MMVRHLIAVVMLGAAALLPARSQAGDHAHAHGAGGATASTRAYQQAMETMHHAMAVPRSGDADVDFVRQMIPHHQAALDMAKTVLAHGHNPALRDFSEWVITAQTQEIMFMQQWLRRRDNGAAPAGAVNYYGPAMEIMHAGMMIGYTGDTDVDFARGMIAHHQGAVDMAGVLLTHGSDPELIELARNIQFGQSYEIAWLQHWLARRGDVSFPSFNP